jgi:DNA-binding NarL/FixJ family response regulator
VIRPRVLLADDHLEFLEAEIALLRPHFALVGTVSEGVSLISETERLNPDIVVVDITMPFMNGIDATWIPATDRSHNLKCNYGNSRSGLHPISSRRTRISRGRTA